jgi:hypothetical protein
VGEKKNVTKLMFNFRKTYFLWDVLPSKEKRDAQEDYLYTELSFFSLIIRAWLLKYNGVMINGVLLIFTFNVDGRDYKHILKFEVICVVYIKVGLLLIYWKLWKIIYFNILTAS